MIAAKAKAIGRVAFTFATTLLGWSAFSLPTGCASARPTVLEPRYVAVHNTLAAMGLTQVGPIHQGSLAEGRDARFSVQLPALCTTLVAMGGAGVRDLDILLLDAEDRTLAEDTTRDVQAAVRVCPEKAGRFTIVVRMKQGAGDYVAASWAGLGTAEGAATAAIPSATTATSRAGNCESPLVLEPGSSAGNTRRGEAEHAGSCGSSDAKELVYQLEVTKRQRVTIEIDPTFDSVLYLRKDDCADKDSEVVCNDDVSSGGKRTSAHGSRIDEVLEPATYYVFVDGYNNEAGSFRMNAQVADVPTLVDACQKAHPMVPRATGTLVGAFDHGHGSCDQANGPDVLHRLDLPRRARVRVRLRSDDFSPVVHVRRTCVDEQSEVACSESGVSSEEAAVVVVLDPGAYAVFADSGDKAARGSYTLDTDLGPEAGSGVRGDSCADAIPLTLDDKGVQGDTFEARDDMAGSCAAPGAPDVVYRFEVPKRMRVTARMTGEEGAHVFALSKSCGERSTELACGPQIDQVLAPGPYWLAVDGTAKGPFGRFAFQLKGKDVTAQEGACRAPPALVLGQPVTGTTAGAGDRFSTSCAGREDAQSSGDRVFALTLAKRTRLQLLLSTPGHDGVLAVRKSCVDPPQMKSLRSIEAGCNNDAPDNRHSKIDTTLDPGTYWVVVDGHQGKNEGSFTLEAKALK